VKVIAALDVLPCAGSVTRPRSLRSRPSAFRESKESAWRAGADAGRQL